MQTVNEYIEQLNKLDTLLGSMLAVISMAKYGEDEALRPKAKQLKEMYMSIRASLTEIGGWEANAALDKYNLALKFLESSGIDL